MPDIIDYTPPVPHVEVVDPNDHSAFPTSSAAKYAFIRSARVVFGALIASVLVAVTATLANFTAVPGGLNSDTFATFVIITVLGSALNGVSKFLRDKNIITNPPV